MPSITLGKRGEHISSELRGRAGVFIKKKKKIKKAKKTTNPSLEEVHNKKSNTPFCPLKRRRKKKLNLG